MGAEAPVSPAEDRGRSALTICGIPSVQVDGNTLVHCLSLQANTAPTSLSPGSSWLRSTSRRWISEARFGPRLAG